MIASNGAEKKNSNSFPVSLQVPFYFKVPILATHYLSLGMRNSLAVHPVPPTLALSSRPVNYPASRALASFHKIN